MQFIWSHLGYSLCVTLYVCWRCFLFVATCKIFIFIRIISSGRSLVPYREQHMCQENAVTNNNFSLSVNDVCWFVYHFTCPSSVVSFVNVCFVLACSFLSVFIFLIFISFLFGLTAFFFSLFLSFFSSRTSVRIFRSIRVCYLIFQQTMSAFVTKHLIYFVDFVFINRR